MPKKLKHRRHRGHRHFNNVSSRVIWFPNKDQAHAINIAILNATVV